ncbi:MAG: YARHG domain-containing protein [Clostridiales bacterium]|nr:YARHG domain-containing protein [Clostridiales bacterium]
MNCPYCHQETEDTAAFCTKCGRRIPRCPTCGEVITNRIRFCTRDGTPIPEELTQELPELGAAAAETSAEQWKNAEEPTQEPPDQGGTSRRSGGTAVILVIAIIVVAVIIAAVFLWTKGMLDQSEDETAGENQTSIVDRTVDEDSESENDAEEDAGSDDAVTDETADETEEPEAAEETEQIEISLTAHDITLYVGESCQIIGANADQVSWTYSEPGVVQVDGSGRLTAYAEGTVVATATGANGETDSVNVTVLAAETEEQEEPDSAEETEDTENTGDADTSDDYILPNSSSEYLSESDMYGLTEWECRIARNEIYARNGMIFTTDEMKEYFGSKSWYHGTIARDDFTADMLNEYELANINLIVAYEAEMGYNQTN